MIVVNSRAGQRSNRLVTIANAMALAIERGEDLWLTAFEEFGRDYTCQILWGGSVRIRDSMSFELVRKMLAVLKRLGWRRAFYGHIVSDWDFRARELVEKHAEVIRMFFQPRQPILHFERMTNEVVVGVHKRRGDYKEFLGGRYYYEDDVYERNIAALGRYYARQGRDTRIVMFPDSDPVSDQAKMSECDCLLGPPSSFSAWAAFMGHIPIAIIWSRDYTVDETDVVYRGLYV